MKRQMKKVFCILSGIVIIAMTLCSCGYYENPLANGYDFETVSNGDREMVFAKYGMAVKHYEAQAYYKYNLDLWLEHNPIIKIVDVFQNGDTVIMVHHFMNSGEIGGLVRYAEKLPTWHTYTIDTNQYDYTFILLVKDHWLEDLDMNMGMVVVSLDSAMVNLSKTYRTTPESNFMAMRQPVTTPPYPSAPYYMFGTYGDGIAIDSYSGNVVEAF